MLISFHVCCSSYIIRVTTKLGHSVVTWHWLLNHWYTQPYGKVYSSATFRCNLSAWTVYWFALWCPKSYVTDTRASITGKCTCTGNRQPLAVCYLKHELKLHSHNCGCFSLQNITETCNKCSNLKTATLMMILLMTSAAFSQIIIDVYCKP